MISADEMHRAGQIFYRSANGIWLVDSVPMGFLGGKPPALSQWER